MNYRIEGYISFTAGKQRSECPYPILSSAEIEWLKGWNRGKKEDEFFAQLYEYDIPEGEVIKFDLYPERNFK